ncbi:MAG: hypothetical protein RRY79_04265 [Clostridia bacterium]
MAISLYLSNKNVSAVVGAGSSAGVSVSSCFADVLMGESLVNGVITNAPALKEEIALFLDAHGCHGKDVSLVVNSTLIQLKPIEFPNMKEKQLQLLMANEFSDAENRTAPLYDYMMLKSKNGSMNRAIACACEKSFVETYVKLFSEIKTKVVSFNTGVTALVKLIEFMPEFNDKTAVIVVMDGENVQNVLLENGRYKISTRTRLFSSDGTDEIVGEMQRNVSSMVQFLASEKSEYTITDVYFCGANPDDLNRFYSFGVDMNLNIQEFPNDRRIKFSGRDEDARLSNFIYPVGDLLKK